MPVCPPAVFQHPHVEMQQACSHTCCALVLPCVGAATPVHTHAISRAICLHIGHNAAQVPGGVDMSVHTHAVSQPHDVEAWAISQQHNRQPGYACSYTRFPNATT